MFRRILLEIKGLEFRVGFKHIQVCVVNQTKILCEDIKVEDLLEIVIEIAKIHRDELMAIMKKYEGKTGKLVNGQLKRAIEAFHEIAATIEANLKDISGV